MNDNDDILNALNKIPPSKGFEDMLFSDALGEMDDVQTPSIDKISPKPTIWASMALLGSLAIGVYLGFDQYNLFQDSLAAIGFGNSSNEEILLYSDGFYEQSFDNMSL